MSTLRDARIDPSEVSPEILRQLEEIIQDRPTLVGPDGERIELPAVLNDLLVFVVRAMKQRRAVLLMPEDEAFTTQAAANFLGMSRPYLCRLLEAGKIPFHRVGTHRRVMFKDLLDFQASRSKERNAALSALTKELDAAGLYDRYVEPER